jgi:hypothetical protein
MMRLIMNWMSGKRSIIAFPLGSQAQVSPISCFKWLKALCVLRLREMECDNLCGSYAKCTTTAGSKNKIVNSFQSTNDNLLVLSCKPTKGPRHSSSG